MLELQTKLLRFAGILPLLDIAKARSSLRTTLNIVHTGVGVCLLLGNLYLCCVNAAEILYGLVNATPVKFIINQTKESAILLFVQFMPFLTIAFRSFCVLFLLFLKRQQWNDLLDHFNYTLEICLLLLSPVTFLKSRMKLLSAVFCIVTFVLQLIWESVEWVVYLDGQNITMYNSDYMAPLPIVYYTFQGITIWTIFCTIPFIISQQFFTCIIMLAIALCHVLRALNREVNEETRCYEQQKSVAQKKILSTAEKVANWEKCYMAALMFCEKVNVMFGWTLLVLYGLDFITLLGFAANIVNNSRRDAESYGYLFFSVLLWLFYLTVCFFPLVASHEASLTLKFALHRLELSVHQATCRSDDFFRTVPPNGRLLKKVRRFGKACRDHPLIFSGAKIIDFSRALLVGTCTFALSFMIIAREFFVKEKVVDAIRSLPNR